MVYVWLAKVKQGKRAKFGYGRENSKPDLNKGEFAPKPRGRQTPKKPVNLS